MREVNGVYCGTCKRELFEETEVYLHASRHATPVAYTEANGYFLGEPRPVIVVPAITVDEIIDLVALPESAWSLEAVL